MKKKRRKRHQAPAEHSGHSQGKTLARSNEKDTTKNSKTGLKHKGGGKQKAQASTMTPITNKKQEQQKWR